MSNFKVFISGQKFFAESVLAFCLQRKGVEVVGVCCPVEDKYIRRLARINEIPIINAGALNYDSMPEDVDLGITAHSFDYIGKKTRYKPKNGWIGYHPSLLPRHRGRSSIEWAIRMGDPITGGTVYWLNAGIDRGDILSSDWCFIDKKLQSIEIGKATRELWRESLFDIGVNLLSEAIVDIQNGVIKKQPQNIRFSTFEPSTDVKDIYKPDLLMLDAPREN
jgi:methionyl-tRNA formyltransferase